VKRICSGGGVQIKISEWINADNRSLDEVNPA
jgi:hypothetical protein